MFIRFDQAFSFFNEPAIQALRFRHFVSKNEQQLIEVWDFLSYNYHFNSVIKLIWFIHHRFFLDHFSERSTSSDHGNWNRSTSSYELFTSSFELELS